MLQYMYMYKIYLHRNYMKIINIWYKRPSDLNVFPTMIGKLSVIIIWMQSPHHCHHHAFFFFWGGGFLLLLPQHDTFLTICSWFSDILVTFFKKKASTCTAYKIFIFTAMYKLLLYIDALFTLQQFTVYILYMVIYWLFLYSNVLVIYWFLLQN